jgi:hypothetical protein
MVCWVLLRGFRKLVKREGKAKKIEAKVEPV